MEATYLLLTTQQADGIIVCKHTNTVYRTVPNLYLKCRSSLRGLDHYQAANTALALTNIFHRLLPVRVFFTTIE